MIKDYSPELEFKRTTGISVQQARVCGMHGGENGYDCAHCDYDKRVTRCTPSIRSAVAIIYFSHQEQKAMKSKIESFDEVRRGLGVNVGDDWARQNALGTIKAMKDREKNEGKRTHS